jgi:hypothetical protein
MPKLQHVSECYTCGLEFVTQREVEEEWRCPDCEAKPKLRFHYSLEHSNKVLERVRDILDQEAPERWEGTVSAWSNCREQGYHLESDLGAANFDYKKRRELVFAQTRNSDSIVVIYGTGGDFCTQSHMPKDEVWEKRRQTFGSDAKAARFIVDHLLRKE